jgi:hypothetical protein
MQKFNVQEFNALLDQLFIMQTVIDDLIHGYSPNDAKINFEQLTRLFSSFQSVNTKEVLKGLEETTNNIGLIAASKNLQLTISNLDTVTLGELKTNFRTIRSLVYEELKEKHFIFLTNDESLLFENVIPFGKEVAESFPSISYDVVEATKCLAIQRYTATVFHLMKVLEIVLQVFANKIGAKFNPEKEYWKTINDNINGKINAMDPSLELTKKYQSASAYLNNVRVAWRNEVMHPKAEYNQEEASEVYYCVEVFVTHLSKINELKENKA